MRHLRLRGDFPAALEVLSELHTFLRSEAVANQRVSDRNLAFFKLEQGILLFFVERFAEAIESLRECALLWQHSALGDYIPAFAYALSALIHALMGSPASARQHLVQSQEIFGEVQDYHYISVLTVTVESLLALSVLDLSRAASFIQRLERLAPESELWSIAAATAQRVDLARGAPRDALSRLDLLQHTAVGASRLSPLARKVYVCARMDALQATGSLQRAREVRTRSGLQSGHICVSEIRLYLIAGQPEHALNLVECAQHEDDLPGPERGSMELLKAAALLQLNQPLEAETAFDDALRRMAKMETLLPFCALPGDARSQLVEMFGNAQRMSELAMRTTLTEPELRRRIDGLPQIFPGEALLVNLTPREVLVLELLDARTTQAEMASLLNLSLSTVKKQVAAVYRKLRVESRAEAMRVVYDLRLLGSAP
jgi:LuxR family maltose regulon positive regulatory protein